MYASLTIFHSFTNTTSQEAKKVQMEQNYYLTSQKTFLIALSLVWAEVAIKILSLGEISAIFQTLGEVSATIRNLRGGLCNYPLIISLINNTLFRRSLIAFTDF